MALAYSLGDIPYVIITLLIAFTLHEFAHAYVAYKFGDNTAKREGRVTLNPLSHIDPIGAFFILIFGFGWAKPVPVNRYKLRNPKLGGVLVSLAGPLSNFILAFIGYFMFFVLFKTSVTEFIPGFYAQGLVDFFDIFVRLNVMLCVFNLLPLPPLDGYRIIEDLAPNNIRAKMASIEAYGFIIFLILFVTPLGDYTIIPIMSAAMNGVLNIILSVLNLFFM